MLRRYLRKGGGRDADSTRPLSLMARRRLARALLACLVVFAFFCAPVWAQRRSGRRAQGARPRAEAVSQEFKRLAAEANAAREQGRLDEAVELYRRALRERPRWDEGWWYLATILYDRDRYAEAAEAFARAAELQPKVGGPRAMLALCEFRLGRYDDALRNIQQVRQLGIVENPELVRVLRYHESLLLLLKGEFEIAQQNLDAMAFEGAESESLIIALGLAVLRVPALPSQITPSYRDHELIRRAGWAALQSARRNTADAQREYERLVADFPKTPNVQYAFGRFLLVLRDDDGALAAFRRELENSPQNVVARLQIAHIRLKNKEAAAGLPYAEEAVKLNNRVPLGRYILGRLLFETGDNARAIEELEIAQRLAPEDPKVYFALSRAYAKANRKADAARARETFLRLNQKIEEANAQRGAKGGASDAAAEGGEP